MDTSGTARRMSSPPDRELRTWRLAARLRPRGPLGWIRRAAAITVAGLVLLGVYQAFIATTPALHVSATVVQPPVAAVDVWRSSRTDAVQITLVAPVIVDRIAAADGLPGADSQRILYDAPATATAGDRIAVTVSLDGRQVRAGALPGPAVLPGPQGATLLLTAALWLLLVVVMRLRRRVA